MPAILVMILSSFASSLVARLIIGAGLVIYTYNFVDDLVAQAQNQIAHLLNGLPADVLGLISILKLPQSLSIIMSALGFAAFIKTTKVFLGRAT